MDTITAQPAQTVLIVDFDGFVRHEIAGSLRGCGYRVIEADTTNGTVAAVEVPQSPRLDAVLCDAEAPGSLSAFALSRLVRERRSGFDAIVAGNVERAAEAAGLLRGEGPRLARPYDPALVVDRIERRLAERERHRRDRSAQAPLGVRQGEVARGRGPRGGRGRRGSRGSASYASVAPSVRGT